MPSSLRTPVPQSKSEATRSGGAGVLFSGGLDSAVLLADEASRGAVHPIYISVGLSWEAAERATIDAFLQAFRGNRAAAAVKPLVALSVDMRDVYPKEHWAVAGHAPGYHTSDEDVYLPGRNVVLLGKAGVYCATAGLDRLTIGTLDHNPFPDATPTFREAMAAALSLGLAHSLSIAAPYADLDKEAVIRRGASLGVPFAFTLSCMNATAAASVTAHGVVHCGICSKCRERHDAFLGAGLDDPTPYADRVFVEQGRSHSG